MRLLVDLSSIAKTGLYQGKDKEFGYEVEHNGKKVYVNGWQHGYERFIGYLTTVMDQYQIQPHNVILVLEGMNSKARRKAIYPLYKSSREEMPEEYNEEFNALKFKAVNDLRNIGVHTVSQDGVEADDVIAYLAQQLRGEVIILSNDADLSILCNDRVMQIRDGQILEGNPLGPFPSKFITLFKAIVGDKSDTIKGAHGFGDKAWLDFLVWAGDQGLAALEGMIKRKTLHELAEDVGEFKPLQRIVDSAGEVYKCFEVAKLHPEWCNTLRQPLQWKAGIVRGRDVVTDERLRPYAQQIRLVTAENYDKAVQFLQSHLASTPVFALDLETSTPDESDEWLAQREAESKVDVFGSEITGMGLTFGANGQYTFYFSVDHCDTPNITIGQLKDVVAMIPAQGQVHLVVHNASFELPICYAAFGEDLKDNGWHGFLPNVVDTKHMASYVDENFSLGLKKLSERWLDYHQTTYEEVTTFEGQVGTLPKGGKRKQYWEVPKKKLVMRDVLDPVTNELVQVEEWVTVTYEGGEPVFDAYGKPVLDDDGNPALHEAGDPVIDRYGEKRQYKMNELTGEHVLAYGTDDTICTAALYHFFKIILEIEDTWDVLMQVEQKPAYVTALAFHQGTEFDLAAMKQMEREDAAVWEEHAMKVQEYLVKINWPGTVCPVYGPDITPAQVKEMVEIVLGQKLETQVRTISKLAILIGELDHPDAPTLAEFLADSCFGAINSLVRERFTGVAELDTDSPKQMKEFLYDYMKLPVRVVGSCTKLERQKKPDLARAVTRYKRIWAGSTTEPPLTDEEKELLKQKAKTNEIALNFALLLDADHPDIDVLKHIQIMKKVETRRKLYYEPYANIRHWKDNKIHAQVNQNGTATRRYSSSDPNLQQLPKKGEGVKFRRCFKPHKKDAVIGSVDFSGQELRQGAGQSGDANMMACYVGDNLKDMHSMTAAGAMEKKWGKTKLAELIERFGQPGDDEYALFLRLRKMKEEPEIAKMADDLRKNAKNVNFGAQYDAQAPKLAETLIIPVMDAQAFLEAKYAMFPRFEEWKEEVKTEVSRLGYATTPMGARRHLRDSLLSDEYGVADKALRQGPNFKIQGGSAEQTKLAMARLWDSGILFTLDMVFFAPIHDELVWSVHRDHAVESCRVINEVMTVPYGNLPVPFLGSISIGPNFGDQTECGDEFDKEAIEKALASIFDEVAV